MTRECHVSVTKTDERARFPYARACLPGGELAEPYGRPRTCPIGWRMCDSGGLCSRCGSGGVIAGVRRETRRGELAARVEPVGLFCELEAEGPSGQMLA